MPDTRPPIAARLFGAVELSLHGTALRRLRTRKERWLICLIILHTGRELERDWLAALLWPDSAEATARANLRSSLNELRRVLGEASCLLRAPQPRTLLLDPDSVDADVLAFDRLIAGGDPASLETAVGLYRGPLLEGCHEGWVFQERQVREEAYLNALETLATHAMAAADARSAVGHLRRIVATDPLRESAQRALMQALAAGGNRAAALAVYRELRSLLRRELQIEPDLETECLYHQIEAGVARNGEVSRRPSDRSVAPPDRASIPATPLHNLSHSSTSFIGREREIKEILRLLEATRLLTLTGAGGCGKSRLALEVARTLREEKPDGVWLVELAALADSDLLPQVVATALGIRERSGEALTEALVSALKPKRLLLVLDNCEHLLSLCVPLIDALLRDCSHLQLLATSREPLNMLGETTYRVPSLIPSEAVCLFLDRAAAAQPGFALSPENAAAVARICRSLDGIPLAIELAAARLRTLAVETLADRLEDALRLLTEGNRAALPHHRTLRAMIEWSHDRLSEHEKVLLRRLAVFAGGWTLEAAEAVASCQLSLVSEERPSAELATDNWGHRAKGGPTTDNVFDLLTVLVDKSLVEYVNHGAGGRYHLLETMRQFAQERLYAVGEIEAIRRQHVGYYLTLFQEAEPHLTGPRQKVWLERLEPERDNLRAALGWAVATADAQRGSDTVEIGLRLAEAAYRFWYFRGDYTEGRGWLARLIDRIEGDAQRGVQVPPALRARALFTAGALAWPQGDARATQALHQEALLLARKLGDRRLIAQCLEGLGLASHQQGDWRTARVLLEESLALFRELGDRRKVATLANNVSIDAREQGEYERSRCLLEESLRILREVGDPASTAHPLLNLGALCMVQGDCLKARAYYEESLSIAQAMGDRRNVAAVSGFMGEWARRQADLVTARARYAESLRIAQALGGHAWLQTFLMGLGCVEVMSGEAAVQAGEPGDADYQRGVRLFGAVESVMERTGRAIWAHERADYERCVAVARAGLGEAAFEAAWAAGRAMSVDEAIRFALEEPGADVAAP